jgi:hypothetical protein
MHTIHMMAMCLQNKIACFAAHPGQMLDLGITAYLELVQYPMY